MLLGRRTRRHGGAGQRSRRVGRGPKGRAHAGEIDFGAPTAVEEAGDETVVSGVLPAGRYASLIHTRPYKGLMEANGALLEWIAAEGLKLDMHRSPAGDVFGCRLEIYRTDPKVEKDRGKYVTELAFKLAD